MCWKCHIKVTCMFKERSAGRVYGYGILWLLSSSYRRKAKYRWRKITGRVYSFVAWHSRLWLPPQGMNRWRCMRVCMIRIWSARYSCRSQFAGQAPRTDEEIHVLHSTVGTQHSSLRWKSLWCCGDLRMSWHYIRVLQGRRRIWRLWQGLKADKAFGSSKEKMDRGYKGECPQYPEWNFTKF